MVLNLIVIDRFPSKLDVGLNRCGAKRHIYSISTLYIKATMVKTKSTIQESEGESVLDLGNEARNVD